jgi:hypothetical protein
MSTINWPMRTAGKFVISLFLSVALVLASVLVVSAENKNVNLGGGITGTGSTWTYVDGFGNNIADSYTKGSSSVYYQEVHGKSYSANGGLHLLDSHFSSAYNTVQVDMSGGNLLEAYVSTRHYWRMSPSGGDFSTFTSHNGSFSTSSCWAKVAPCSPYL